MRLLGKVISSTFLRWDLSHYDSHPLDNNNQFHGISPNSKVSDLSWHENAIVISPLSWFVPINLMQIRLVGALALFFAGKEL
jgi:hypothetical protein